MSGTQAKSAMQNAHKFDLGIIACGLLAFVFSMFPFYSAEVKTSGGPTGFDLGDYGGGSWSAWHGFFGWFAALLALAVAILLALKLLARDDETRPQDASDLRALRLVATNDDLALARETATLITERGYSRGRDLIAMLEC